jgi:transcriptional regulator with XRE-family HTH domain
MKWLAIRAHYAALHAQAQAAGLTQKAIAERGGIAGQNSVSRLLSNDHLGPSVEIFVRAIEGLGKPVSQFFLELEQQQAAAAARELSVLERLQRIERLVQHLSVLMSSSSLLSSGRPHDGGAVLSPPVSDPEKFAALDRREQIQVIVQAASEGFLAELAARDARVADVGAGDGDVPVRQS